MKGEVQTALETGRAYTAGWNYAINGPTDTNCSFKLFATPEMTTAWELGKRNAEARLIAAAPELLEAARHAVMEWRLHGQLTDSCRVLEAAIQKAEGR